MDNIIIKSLQSLNLTPKEIKFFLACFKVGPATINEVTKESKLERSTAYIIAEDLIAKGFIKEDLKSYKKIIYTVEPKDLLRMVAGKQRSLRRQELELEENLPDLQSLYQASEFRPKAKVFEGNNGLISVWKDILSSKSEILLWTNQQTESLFFNHELHEKFIDERVKKGIKIRVLAVNNKTSKTLVITDKKNIRQTKLLPKGYGFSAETYIYDNKVAILDYNKDIIGIIIESEPISSTQKTIFELTWKSIHLYT